MHITAVIQPMDKINKKTGSHHGFTRKKGDGWKMKERPVLSIPKTPMEFFLNIIAILLLIGNFIYLWTQWETLPRQIPIHFNMAGEADGWGNKALIWLLPVLGVGLWIGLTILEKFPHTYNYLNLTEQNVERQYKNARMMINALKNESIFFFVYLSWKSVQTAHGYQAGFGVWDILLFLLVIFGSLGFFTIRAFRIR